MAEDEEARFSRSGMSCVFGKCTEEVKAKVPEDVKEKIAALAAINDLSVSEYIRDMCIERVYGHLAILRARAGNGMSGMGPE